MPKADDINIDGLDIDKNVLEQILTVDKKIWLEDVEGQKEFFAKFGDRLPKEIKDELANLEERLSK